MKWHPILFSDEMVRAILDGRKTQTRRVIKDTGFYCIDEDVHGESAERERKALAAHCPYGAPGDRLYVKEAWCQKTDDGRFIYNADGNVDSTCCHYRADGVEVFKDDGDGGAEFTKAGYLASPWASPRFMPKRVARIWLEIVDVRVERLQDISEEDAKAEGVQIGGTPATYRGGFAALWDAINGKKCPWKDNPWVWVCSPRPRG